MVVQPFPVEPTESGPDRVARIRAQIRAGGSARVTIDGPTTRVAPSDVPSVEMRDGAERPLRISFGSAPRPPTQSGPFVPGERARIAQASLARTRC
jgi:hypothetical protein